MLLNPTAGQDHPSQREDPGGSWYHSLLLVATGGGCWPRASLGFSVGMPRMLPSAELLPLQRAGSRATRGAQLSRRRAGRTTAANAA